MVPNKGRKWRFKAVTESQRRTAAMYLIGQGTYFRPHLIELQYYRILRYCQLVDKSRPGELAEYIDGVYVDLFPRTGRRDTLYLDQLSQFCALLEAVKRGSFQQVLTDIQGTDPRGLSYNGIQWELEKAGAQVINISHEDKTLHDELEVRFGKAAYRVHQNETTDFVAFFPTLAGDIGEVLLHGYDIDRKSDNPAIDALQPRIRVLRNSRAGAGVGNCWPMWPDFLYWHGENEKKRLDSLERRRQIEPLYSLWPHHMV